MKSLKKVQPHLFSLYLENIQNKVIGRDLLIKDELLISRIKNVLRISPKDELQFFDGKYKCITKMNENFKDKKSLYFELKDDLELVKENNFKIHLLCSLLKKENLEIVSRVVGALGIESITPILTNKVQRDWGGEKEKERLKKIIISGCEQSKNCVIPILNNPISFQQMLEQEINTKKVHFDVTGKSNLLDLMKSLNSLNSVYLFFGPEGDLTQEEYDKLKGFERVQINQNVLTSTDAITIALGSIKSLK